MSFPLGIFLIPYYLSSQHNPQDYPPIVVTLSTTLEHLPSLQPTLESILLGQSASPTRVYLVLMDPTQEDMFRGKVGFQKEQDELETLGASSSSWPSYLQRLVDTTPLQVLHPKTGFGALSKIVYALQYEEQRETEKPASATESIFRDTTPRLIYLEDDVILNHNSLQTLMDASIDHPQNAVAFAGGTLRSKFRQVRYAKPSKEYDKFPNVVLQSLDISKEPLVVDIVQQMTGVCLPMTLLNSTNVLQLIQQTGQQQQQDDSWPNSIVSDVLISAVMESQNVTRLLIPSTTADGNVESYFSTIQFANYSTNPISLSGRGHKNSYDVSMEWIGTVSFLQSSWKIWQEYDFMDPKSITTKQKQAMVCEALHEPDCLSQANLCLASSSECANALSILKEMDRRDFVFENDADLAKNKEGDE
jgi:hypothetical protein